MKTTYANGDVYSASDVNDTNGTINLLGSSVAYTAGKNKLINADFGIWQRGTSSATTGYQTADRWFCNAGGTTTFSRDTSVPTDIFAQYSLKWTTGAVSSFGQPWQAMERDLVIPMRSEPMVFSIYVKTTGTALSGTLGLKVLYSNSTDAYASLGTTVTVTGNQTFTPTATWTRYSGTFTVPADAVGLKVGVEPSVVQASGVVVFFAGAQLEQGSTATAFQTATGTTGGELSLCQRYFNRMGGETGYNTFTNAYIVTTTSLAGALQFPVKMRIAPTPTFTAGSNYGAVLTNNTVITATSVSADLTTTYNMRLTVGYTSGGLSIGQGCILLAPNTSSYIDISAEL
jgi:hypothetical protein